LDYWVENVELRELPEVPQHGDFVHNNLGRARDTLYVFDWEDYGKVCLPGFDLAMLNCIQK
jgi:thiamine kinase-like enzyme